MCVCVGATDMKSELGMCMWKGGSTLHSLTAFNREDVFGIVNMRTHTYKMITDEG